MKRFTDAGALNPQWDEVVNNALDRRQFADILTPATPDEEYSIEHGFETQALGFIVISQDKPAVTYKGATVWDDNRVYLKTNTGNVAARIMVF